MPSIVSYVHEAWFPVFLVAFFANMLVLVAMLATDAVKRGYKPFTGVMAAGGLGMLLMMTPTGFTIWALLNLMLCCAGLPPKVLFIAVTLPISLFVGFWKTLLSGVMRPRKRESKKEN